MVMMRMKMRLLLWMAVEDDAWASFSMTHLRAAFPIAFGKSLSITVAQRLHVVIQFDILQVMPVDCCISQLHELKATSTRNRTYQNVAHEP